MKLKILISFVFLFTFNCLSIIAQNEQNIESSQTGTLTIEIVGFESDEGQVIVSLFNSKETWPKETVQKVIQKILNKKSIIVFNDLPFGEYGAAVIHDDNNNSKMDTNFLGIPSEDYGFSNDAEPSFGPASWNDAKFLINKRETKILINIQ